MRVYIDTTKLLQEGKITQSEFERLQCLASKWNNPFISSVLSALVIIFGTMIIGGSFAWMPPVIILFGLLVMALDSRGKER